MDNGDHQKSPKWITGIKSSFLQDLKTKLKESFLDILFLSKMNFSNSDEISLSRFSPSTSRNQFFASGKSEFLGPNECACSKYQSGNNRQV